MNQQKINQYFLFLILQISIIYCFDCAKMPNCLDCDTQNGCTECEDNSFLNQNGTCDTCRDLIVGCQSCSNETDNINCQMCQEYFEKSPISDSICLNSGCTGKDDSRCTKCTPDQLSCTSCSEGFYLKKYESINNEYYNCETCDSSIQGCTKCSADGQICFECDTKNKYKLNSEQKCFLPQCSPSCLECAADGVSCAKCQKDQYLTQDQTNCKNCSKLHKSCSQCSNEWSCTQCSGSSEEGFCEKCNVLGCYQCSPDGKSCLQCYETLSLSKDKSCTTTNCQDDNCYKCTADAKSCLRCSDEYNQYLIESLNEMGEKINKCFNCDQLIPNCDKCYKNDSNEFICTSCYSGTNQSLDQKQCLLECEENQVGIIDKNSVQKCSCSELFFYNTQMNQCSQSCPDGQLGVALNNSCIPLNNCDKYVSSDNKRCLDQCPILEILSDQNKNQCQKQTTLSSQTLSKVLTTILTSTNSQNTATQLSDYIDTILVQDKQFTNTNAKVYQLLNQSVLALQTEILKQQNIQKIVKESDDFTITILSVSETHRFNCLTEIDQNNNITSQYYLHLQDHTKCNEIDSDTLSIIVSKQQRQQYFAQNITIPYIQFWQQSSSNSRMLYQSTNSFKVNIPVNVTNKNINKFWCVSMLNNQPLSSLKSIPNPNNSTITCQFSNNTSIIYDDECEYVNSSLCPKENKGEGLSILSIIFIVLGSLLGIIIAIIAYICIKKRKFAKQYKYSQASNIDSLPDSTTEAIN